MTRSFLADIILHDEDIEHPARITVSFNNGCLEYESIVLQDSGENVEFHTLPIQQQIDLDQQAYDNI